MSKLNVCSYCRVSTNSKDQQNSFENQKSYFEREIEKNKDYKLYKIYADKGITGTSLSKRPEFNQMLYDAGIDVEEHQNNKGRKVDNIYTVNTDREPKFNLIFVKNSSRFARNVMITDIIRKLKQKKVYVYFLDINKTTENEGDELLLQILFTLDENESKDKSRKVRMGQMEGAMKGVINTNTLLYGYKYIKEENRLEIIEEEAKVIRKIYDLYLKQYGIRRISNELDKENIRTRTGKFFSKSTLNRILSNEKYCGMLVRNKYYSGIVFEKLSYPHLKEKDEWIVHEDRIPPIVTQETFNRVQEIKNSKISTINQKGLNYGKSKYCGKLICESCGNTYISNVDRGVKFYNCKLKKTKGISACSSPNIKEELIDEEIKKLVDYKYIELFEAIDKFTVSLLENIKKDISSMLDVDTKNKVNELKEELKKLEIGLSRLLDLYTNLDIDKNDYIIRSESIKIKIEDIDKQIMILNKDNSILEKDIKDIDDIINKINNTEKNKPTTEEEMLKEIEYINIDFNKDTNKIELFPNFEWTSNYKKIIAKYAYQSEKYKSMF